MRSNRSKFITTLAVLISLAGISASQEQNKPADPNGPSTGVVVTLNKDTHVKRVKVGDKVEAKTEQPLILKNGARLSSGAKVIGHVTVVNVKPDGTTPSEIGILFDKVVVGKNEEVPITTILVCVAPPAPKQGADVAAVDSGNNSWGRMGSAASGSGHGTAGKDPGSAGLGTSNTGEKAFQFEPGVSYIDNVKLSKFLPDGVGTVIESAKSQLFLDQGTRMMLQIQ